MNYAPNKSTSKHFLMSALAGVMLLAATRAQAVKVDFLWVIDNSPSMGDKQDVLASTANAIQDQLNNASCHIDWRMAVTYTDLHDSPSSDDVCPGSPGPGRRRLCPFTSNMSVFQNGTSQCAYVKAGSCGDPSERGFDSADLAIQRLLAGSGCANVPNTDCHIRPDARLAVIFMTDSGEQTPNASRPPSEPDNSVQSWVDYFNDFDLLTPGAQRAQVHGILCPLRPTPDDPAPCGDRLSSSALFDRYSDVIADMGGTEGSISDTSQVHLSDTIMHIVDATIAGACCGNGVLDPGEECDDGNLEDGDCCSSKCKLESSTTMCRPAAGPCDVAEFCTGSSPSCPADGFKPSSFQCRGATGSCDVAEFCTGTAATCPADAFKPATTVCRPSTAPCDAAEFCTGTSGLCPNDGLKPAGAVCRPAAGPCDAPEVCNGTSSSCPADVKSTGVCRPANGACDVAETCDGTSNDCPADAFKPATTKCRAVAGPCDEAEYCTGSAPDCPADAFKPSTTKCRNAAGDCDAAEFCTGGSASCPVDVMKPAGTECRPAAGPCDAPEVCTGSSPNCPADAIAAAGTVCRPAAGGCDVAEVCDGTSMSCPADQLRPAGFECRAAAGECDQAETCSGTSALCPADAKKTDVCRPAAGPCDAAERCDGSSNTCPPDGHAPDGTACDDGNACTEHDTCAGGTCAPGTPKACTPDQCHDAGACDPQTGTCNGAPKPDGTPCDDANACTDTDVCHAGSCAGTEVSCADDDACTVDSCDPAKGCVNRMLDGFPEVTCACASMLQSPACAGQHIPPCVSGHFRKACRLMAKAATAHEPKRDRLIKKANHQLGRSQMLLAMVTHRGKLTHACAATLDGSLTITKTQTAKLVKP